MNTRFGNVWVWALVFLMCSIVAACGSAGSGGDSEEMACTVSADCPDGQSCVSGACKVDSSTSCLSNNDCPSLFYCDLGRKKCVAYSDGDVDSKCGAMPTCSTRADCHDAGLSGYGCADGCCAQDSTIDCTTHTCDVHYSCNAATSRCEPGSDHCSVTPCGAHQTCDADLGSCTMDADHCSKAGCASTYFTCNATTGDCDATSDNCAMVGCKTHYTCSETTGACSPGSDHCSVAPCASTFDCDSDSGDCKANATNCAKTGCHDHFACDTPSGLCKPDSTHCDTTGCAAHYACNASTGVCDPGPDHCLNVACANHFVCDETVGVCNQGPDHCSTAGCATNFACDASTGDCNPTSQNCIYKGCNPYYTCDTNAASATGGTCITATNHCSNQSCRTGYTCHADTGRCWPASSVCGSSDVCVTGNFLCDSGDLVDCESKCWDDHYPYFSDEVVCRGETSGSGTSATTTYSCSCENYDDQNGNAGSCSAPVTIDRMPFIHRWGMGTPTATTPTAGANCPQTGSKTPANLAFARTYALNVPTANSSYLISAENKIDYASYTVAAVKSDLFMYITNSCGMTNPSATDFCRLIDNPPTLGLFSFSETESFSVTFPTAGTYYITVADAAAIMGSAMGSYQITVTHQ